MCGVTVQDHTTVLPVVVPCSSDYEADYKFNRY